MDEYKYIHFKKQCNGLWYCLTRKSDGFLGVVQWYAPWRQYCFYPGIETVYSVGCLLDIADFVKKQNAAQRERSE